MSSDPVRTRANDRALSLDRRKSGNVDRDAKAEQQRSHHVHQKTLQVGWTQPANATALIDEEHVH